MKSLQTGLFVYLLGCLVVACDFTPRVTPTMETPPAEQSTPIPSTPPVALASAVVAHSVLPRTLTPALQSPIGASPAVDPTAAQQYLQAALDYMQQNYLHRARVDWAGLRDKVAQAIPSPQTIPDTYPAIRYALHLLDDPHTQFLPPEDAHALLEQEQVIGLGFMAVYPERIVVTVNAGGAAEHAGVRVGDRIERINDASTAQMTSDDFFNALFSGTSLRLTLQRAGDTSDIRVTIQHAEYHYPVEGPHGQRLPDSIGYIELPGLAASQPIFHQYAGLVQQHIREIDQPAACGWIVDLRGNLGGDPWDMLAGIGPILGEGTVGAYVYPTGRREAWIYRVTTQPTVAGISG